MFPQDYSKIDRVLKRLQIYPYNVNSSSFIFLIKTYKYLFIVIIFSVILILLLLFGVIFNNKKLKNKQQVNQINQDKLQNKLQNINLELTRKTNEYFKIEQELSVDFKIMQALYSIFLNNNISKEQRVYLVLDFVRKSLYMEVGLLSYIDNNTFKICACSPQNNITQSPISKSLAQQALSKDGVFIKNNIKNYKIYIAYTVFIKNKPHCLFEFISLKKIIYQNLVLNYWI